jgi:DNA-binding CsgD family transcriptional regulator/tetratricopeptide (TPR) repeat protein
MSMNARSPEFDLLERDTEVGAVEALISATPSVGRLLAIEGPPGIGKTSLLVEAKARAQAAGLQVLAARGSELERTFSYGVVRQLFEPLLVRLSADERAETVDGAAALAMPLFDPAQLAAGPTADSSLATLHGLYWLATNVAARRPLLLAVDDLHWCDLPSLRWLMYVLPRMEGLGLSIVVSLRAGQPGEDPSHLVQIVSDPQASVIRPAPLSGDAAAQFVRQALSPDADEAFCAACYEETGGNPFLLRELMHVIVAEGLAATEQDVPRLRELGARAGLPTVTIRLARLSAESRRLAHAVAILGDDADPHQAAALADLNGEAASEAARALALAYVLRPPPPFGFVHPLLGAAVHETLTLHERDIGPARAAGLLSDAGAEPERVAAHLLLTPAAADEAVVATLREAASRAASRGASETATAYLRRALAEPPPAAERAGVLLELGSAEALVSGDAAVEHLREARALTVNAVRRAETALLLGTELFLLLRPEESDAVYRTALDELAGADPELERLLEAGLAINAIHVRRIYSGALQRLDRIRGDPKDETIGEKMLLSSLAYHDARAGAPATVAVPLARRALAGGALIWADVSGRDFVGACMVLAMADRDDALAMYDEALAEAHRRGSSFRFATAKMLRAQAFVMRGDLAEAEAEGREAFAASEAWGPTSRTTVYLAAVLAEALAEQGKLDQAAAALDRIGSGESFLDDARLLLYPNMRARLRILNGDLVGGLEETLEVGRHAEPLGARNPAFLAWRSQAALALLQLGAQDDAHRLAGEEVELARSWGTPRALGAALRAAGLIEGRERGLALLEHAVEVLNGSPAKLEHARARTELGAMLRRANRRSEAREHLRRALELATICGATPLAERAETELRATGTRPRRVALTGIESLTPSERRVAHIAAEGATNREIAQALFVSPKTVEVHLSNVYRKLGISSRWRLPAVLAESAQA